MKILDLDGLGDIRNETTLEIPSFKTKLTQFKSLSKGEVKKLIFISPNKYCTFNLLPTWMVRECIDELLPLITRIINLSLTFILGNRLFKACNYYPLLKKLNRELVKKNYRPISNLAFLSKLIERAVASQLYRPSE